MQGRLFVVEGASASGKDTLLKGLANEGYVVVRGVGSQNPEDNYSLTPKSKEILGDTVLNFREVLKKPPEERDDIFKRFIRIAAVQQEEAIRLKSLGQTVFLNRSAISLVSIIRLPLELADPAKREAWRKWTYDMLDVPITLEYELLRELDGLVLMQEASVGGKEREGLSGIAEMESVFISEEVRRKHRFERLPLVELNANLMSPEEEVSRVKIGLGL